VDGGKAYIHESDTGNLAFVRPHLLEITRQPNGANHFRATTTHINVAGPVVKVDAITEWGAPVHVEMSQEKFRSLALTKGEVVFITPKDVTVFQQG
jgi:ABC-type sulfate/molybdate transport systems ATPase subunit